MEDGTDFRLLILYLLLALYDANREDMTFLRLSANDGNLFDHGLRNEQTIKRVTVVIG